MSKAKSIQEIKDEVARERNCESFEILISNYCQFTEPKKIFIGAIENIVHEVIERYCSQFQSPIVLPDNKMIEEEAWELNQVGDIFKYSFDDDEAEAFITGAKWLRDKIQQQLK